MNWEKAELVNIDPDAFYLVQDNGREWSDFDLSILKGILVVHRLKPEYVRGRPEWICKITRPASLSIG